jgi:outer membrane protein OmpA-like peptidoglycan-associated protein
MKKPLWIAPLLHRKDKEVGPEIESGISAIEGSGQPLAESTRSFFEPRFGSDFSNVRVHKDSYGGRLAEALQAKAFTVGSDIIFGAGQFTPETPAGKHLLAHELVHVVQQGRHQYAPQQTSGVSRATDSDMLDEEAAVEETAAEDIVSPHLTKRYCPRPSLTIQRQPPSPPGKRPPKPLTRAEEIRLSFTSPGEIATTMNPPMISLYNFAINQPTLKKEHLAALKTIALLIKLFPGAKAGLRVEGHADSTGDDIKINEPLSENRAAAAQKVLEGAQIDVFHCGELCPITTNDTVAGRSRNRRVDIYFLSGKKPDDIDWPSLCSLAPALCVCLKDPALCRKKRDGDGDGIDWPCSSLLGALICGLIVCIAASAILRNPMLCLPGLPSLLCLLFPSLCRDKPKPSQTKKEKCCPPINVDLPNGNLPVHAEWPFLMLQEEFEMLLAFKDDPQEGCACRCCEYQQNVRGFVEREFANGRVIRDRKQLTPGIYLEENTFHEDGDGSANSEYGHRSHPPRVIHTADMDFVDAFFPDQASGCYYRGLDKPGIGLGVAPEDEVRWKWFLEFEGGPVDTCAIPGKRTPMKQHWHKWRIDAEIKKPLPPRTPRKPPTICAGLPPNAKVGDKVSLSVHFEGDPEDCYGNIDVMIIALSSTELMVSTQNPDLWNIAPEDEEDCPDMWIHSYQVWTFFGSPPCGYVA